MAAPTGVLNGDLLPNGEVVKGVNLIPTLADQFSATGGTASPPTVWTELWDVWDFNWQTACLDDAVKLGCNTVRIQGTIWGVTSGRLTRAEYLDKWTQLHQACADRGLWLFACGGDAGGNDRFADVPFADVQTEIVALASHLHTLPRVFAFDIVQESNSFTTSTNGKTLYTAVKAVTDLPCTYSCFTVVHNTRFTERQDRVDFYDFHAYYTPDTAVFDSYWSTAVTHKPVLWGEFGAPDSAGQTTTDDRYNAIKGTLTRTSPSGRKPAGAVQWAVRDYDTGSTNRYGVFTNDGVTEKPHGAILRGFPGNPPVPTVPTRKRLLKLGGGLKRIPQSS